MRKLTLICSFTLLWVAALGQNYVTLYDQCNFGGRFKTLTAGNYYSYQLGIGNDKLSSIRVPDGLKITLYEHNSFQGKSVTYTANISCLPSDWIRQASSVVVESTYDPQYNENDYVVFYNDCYSNGYSQSLRPGQYTGTQLGLLKQNISSFAIYGNLRVKAYLNNENLSGYSVTFDNSQTCLFSNANDKIASLVIEYKPANDPGNGDNNSSTGNYISFYANCDYEGNSVRLEPGRYEGNKLGMFRNDISSVEVPTGMRARVYVGSDYLTGTSYTISENTSCLGTSTNNRITSILVEQVYSTPDPGTGNQGGSVIIFMDTYYRGNSASLLPGNYATMSQANFPDNALSSLQVPPGWRVAWLASNGTSGLSPISRSMSCSSTTEACIVRRNAPST